MNDTTSSITAIGETPITNSDLTIFKNPIGEATHLTVKHHDELVVDSDIDKTTSLDSSGNWVPSKDFVSLYSVGNFYKDQKPGYPGVSIIGGHISWNGVPSTFYGLVKVDVNDIITIKYSSGDIVTFEITLIVKIDKTEATDLSTALGKDIWTPDTQDSVIRLFTCDPNTDWNGAHYAGNLVIFGERIT